MYIQLPCFSCFTFHFHQIAEVQYCEMMTLVACEGVVGSLVLLCGERSVQEETLH